MVVDRRDRLLSATTDALSGNRLPPLVMTAMSNGLIRKVYFLTLCLICHLLLLKTRRTLASIQTSDHVGRAFLALVEEVFVGT